MLRSSTKPTSQAHTYSYDIPLETVIGPVLEGPTRNRTATQPREALTGKGTDHMTSARKELVN